MSNSGLHFDHNWQCKTGRIWIYGLCWVPRLLWNIQCVPTPRSQKFHITITGAHWGADEQRKCAVPMVGPHSVHAEGGACITGCGFDALELEVSFQWTLFSYREILSFVCSIYHWFSLIKIVNFIPSHPLPPDSAIRLESSHSLLGLYHFPRRHWGATTRTVHGGCLFQSIASTSSSETTYLIGKCDRHVQRQSRFTRKNVSSQHIRKRRASGVGWSSAD